MNSIGLSTNEQPTADGRSSNLWVAVDETNDESVASAEESSGLLKKSQLSSSSQVATNQKRSGGLFKKSA